MLWVQAEVTRGGGGTFRRWADGGHGGDHRGGRLGGDGEESCCAHGARRRRSGLGGRDVGQSGRVRRAGDTSTEKSSKFHRDRLTFDLTFHRSTPRRYQIHTERGGMKAAPHCCHRTDERMKGKPVNRRKTITSVGRPSIH